ncbi:helix-turn-helix domain-containing protein [Ensifer sp. KUDG1]|uniref:helix-turn-helix domain-containing protein n=1 Tax=Ensifer sp. KUDG1 TaxID=3373919 RepID=UPI003D22D16E
MLADLNLNRLRSFFLIAEERSLTRAAARLNMSQPSVSQGGNLRLCSPEHASVD